MSGDVRIRVDPGVGAAYVLLDRPAARNAISQPLATELVAAIDEADGDDRISCIVLASAIPAVFSAGADLRELTSGDASDDLVQEGTPAMAVVRRRLRSTRVPVVAFADGAVVGGSIGLLLAADLRWASPHATFCVPVVPLGGVLPVVDAVALVRAVGQAAATDLVLTGRTVDHEWAIRHGLVSRVVDGGPDHLTALVAEVAAGGRTTIAANTAVLRSVASTDDVRLTPEVEALCRAAYQGPDRVAALAGWHRRAGEP